MAFRQKSLFRTANLIAGNVRRSVTHEARNKSTTIPALTASASAIFAFGGAAYCYYNSNIKNLILPAVYASAVSIKALSCSTVL